MPDWTPANAARHRSKYGAGHRRARQQWRPIVEAGQAACALCEERIGRTEPWDLAHDPEGGPGDYLGPAHPVCNRGTARTGERGRYSGRYAATGSTGSTSTRRRGSTCVADGYCSCPSPRPATWWLELRDGAPAGGQGEAPAPGMTEPEAPAPRFSGAF